MYFLFDIGGTKTRFALSSHLKTLRNIKVVETPQNFSRAVQLFGAVAREMGRGKKFRAAGGGTPGPFNETRTKIFAGNLPDWKGKNLRAALARTLRTRVYLENDAALAGLGEAIYGAGRSKSIVAYLTISTGVGGARIVDQKIDKNIFGFEPGRQYVSLEPLRQLEAFISGKSLQRRYHREPYELEDKRIWDRVATILAYGLRNAMVHWSPEIVVLGGSLMNRISLDRIRSNLKHHKPFPKLPIIKKAALAERSGLFGALAYLNQMLKRPKRR